jgi:diketogulonate reductase-like aldo/keto reductase
VILHQPLPSRFDLTLEAYRALETLLADGRVRAIGVSNFMRDHLDDLLKNTTVVPAVNQIEVHPYFSQPDVLAANAAHGILSQAWSPIGGITFYREGGGGSTLRPARIAENFDVFGFELTDAELAAIDALDRGVRGGPEPAAITLESFGRDIPDA